MFPLLLCLINANKINLLVSIEENHTLLNWTGVYGDQNISYTAYSKSIISDWRPLSAFDFATTKNVNVLNVYPVVLEDQYYTTFNITNGSSMYLPLSAVLKVWMEGGNYTYNNISYNFTALGTNHNSGEQIIHVTPVSKGDFDKMSLDEMKKYDVIVIGFMDSNGDMGTWFPEDETVQRVSEYIDLGYGVLFGHDVVGFVFGNEHGYGQIASKFGILLGTDQSLPNLTSEIFSNGTFSTGWMHFSDEFRVTKRGLLTNYPYSIPDGNLTCFETHTCSNAAFGDVWAEMGRNTQADIYNYSNFTEAENYAWNLSGYTEPRYGNPHYYLTTYKNTAMIQTGHTFASATLYERQLLTNTIYYLYQKTSHQYLYDNSIETPTLKSPNITTCGYRSIEIQCNNKTETIFYKVIGNSTNGTIYESEETKFNVTSFATRYYYIIDENDSTVITYENLNEANETNGFITDIPNDNVYIHVASYDNFGKLSDTSHFYMEISTETFTNSNTYSQSNTFTKSNTYSQSNTFTNSNTFTKSIKFSQLNTITNSFLHNITLSLTVSLVYSLSITQTLSFYVTQKNSYSICIVNSSNVYIETEFIFYDYTIVIYTMIYSYYSNFFTIIYTNEQLQSDNVNKNIIIISVCVSIIIVIVIIVLIVIIIRIRNNKQISNDIIYENDNDEEKNESTNTFIGGMSNKNIEEDPFAVDFNDEKFNVQI